MSKVSVIIPVYKTEKFISYCLDSVLNQTYKNLEILIVDDGSPDQSGAICDSYAAKDNRITVIHQKNNGVSSARNHGVSRATGKYILFVDSDDFIDKDMIRTMINALENSNADVSICGINYCDESHHLIRSDLINNNQYIGQELINSLFSIPTPLGGYCFNKLFRRQCLENVAFKTDTHYSEDWYYVYDAFCNCKSGIHVNRALYNIVEREDSATRSKATQIESLYHIVLGMKSLTDHVLETNSSFQGPAINKLMDYCLRYGIQIKKLHRESKKGTQKILHIKLIMLHYLWKAYIDNSLQKNVLHGYLFEMFKL